MQWILYVDDLVLHCKEVCEEQSILELIHTTCTTCFGLNISFRKTKSLVFRDGELAMKESIIMVVNEGIKNVSEFCYLRHMITTKPEHTFSDFHISSTVQRAKQNVM